MNVTQILLGSTAVLLVVALVLSFVEMKDGEKGDLRVADAMSLMEENSRLRLELDRLKGKNPGGIKSARDLDTPEEVSDAQLDVYKKQNALLKEQLKVEEAKRLQAEKETLAMNEREAGKYDREARRERMISQAMLMAQVKELPIDAETGKIQLVVLDVKMPQSVRVGTELAIRRGTGIRGKIVVSSIMEGAYFADILTGSFIDGNIDIKKGDELIIPPL